MFYNAEYDQYVNPGVAFTLGDVQYPANWLNVSTPEEKADAGLVEVVATNQPANDQFYWVSTELNGAELTYVNTPKDLAQLKVQWTNQTDSTAYSLLLPSDWMVVKGIETGTPVATDWTNYRQDVRTTADLAKTEIANAADVAALQAAVQAVQWPHDPNWIDPAAQSAVN